MRSSSEMLRQPPTHSARAPLSSTGALASSGTMTTAAIAPSAVPARRYSAFERTAPDRGWLTMKAVIIAQDGCDRPMANAM